MNRYVLKITGKRIDTFIFFLVKLKISFKKIKKTKDYIIIEVTEDDYLKIEKIKTTYKIEIIKRKGLIYFTHFLKTRKLFIVCVIMGYLFLTLLTHLIFDINVIETDEELKETILQDLEEYGLKKYGFKVTYEKKEQIEKRILEKEKDLLEWLEIEEKGVSYEVKLIKRIKDNIKKETEPRHIVASKKGIITRIVAEKGEIVTKKNAYVNKGDILISGLIKNKDNIVSKTRAIGEVYAEIWYKVSLSLPINYHEEKKTGNSKEVLEIDFLNNNYSLTDYNSYSHYVEDEKIIWYHPLLPLSLNFTKKEEIELTNIDYSKNYKKNIKPLAIEKLKNKLGSDINILSEKVLKKEQIADKINIDIFFKVEENITSYKSLKDFNIEEENKKVKEES